MRYTYKWTSELADSLGLRLKSYAPSMHGGNLHNIDSVTGNRLAAGLLIHEAVQWLWGYQAGLEKAKIDRMVKNFKQPDEVHPK